LIRAAIACALLSGAAMAATQAPDSEAINAAIHKACRLSRAQARILRSDGVDHLIMSPNMTYKQIKCASEAASAAGAHLPQAFVGKIS
jgi:hypothetical protein